MSVEDVQEQVEILEVMKQRGFKPPTRVGRVVRDAGQQGDSQSAAVESAICRRRDVATSHV